MSAAVARRSERSRSTCCRLPGDAYCRAVRLRCTREARRPSRPVGGTRRCAPFTAVLRKTTWTARRRAGRATEGVASTDRWAIQRRAGDEATAALSRSGATRLDPVCPNLDEHTTLAVTRLQRVRLIEPSPQGSSVLTEEDGNRPRPDEGRFYAGVSQGSARPDRNSDEKSMLRRTPAGASTCSTTARTGAATGAAGVVAGAFAAAGAVTAAAGAAAVEGVGGASTITYISAPSGDRYGT